MCSTPLAKIPWEYAFFYMSPEEFQLIPAGSYIEKVNIKVLQTVASTAFPTGATTATVATTNHAKVLVVGHDLEAKCRGGMDRGIVLDADMNVTIGDNKTTIFDDFIAKQYGTDQTAATGTVVIPGAAHKIPWYNKLHYFIYQPDKAQAEANGFFTADPTTGAITNNYAPGYEYFQNFITELNSNDTTFDQVAELTYKFTNAPIGEQFPQLEIVTADVNQSTGNAAYYNAKRNVSGATVLGDTTFTESYVPSKRSTIPVVTYKGAPMEQGSYFVRGDAAGKPSRQPSFHIGMRAIDKVDPTTGASRSSTFVQANIEFEVEATMEVILPSYPNRFMRPKFYNTSLENAVMGIGTYPSYADPIVSFGLYNEVATAPTLDEIDRGDRPRRSLPNVSGPVTRSRARRGGH